MISISSRLAAVKPSASAWVSQAASEAKARGVDIIDLGLGEPDFDTPDHIKMAAHQAALNGETKYPPTVGTLAMRNAVVEKLKRENDLNYTIDQIIVSNGAKQVIFNALMATLEANDEVLLCAPYFGQYKDMVQLLGGRPVALHCPAEAGFCTTPEQLESAITPQTKWLLLNLPSNPAGAVYSKKDLQAIGAVLERHPQVMVMSDEIYEHIMFDDRTFNSFAAVNPALKSKCLTVNGVSKAYAMTGWRIGYGAGPEALISAMTKVQSQISSGACSIAQAAAATALSGPQHDVQRFRKAFETRRNFVVERVAQIDGLTLEPPGGAFYALIGCEAFIGAQTSDGDILADDVAFTTYLLNTAGVATVPGSAYEMSPYFRISTAASLEVLDAAMTRISAAVAALKPEQNQ